MSKKFVKSPGNLYIHSYLGDISGVGTIRVIIPFLLLNTYVYNKVSVTASYNQFFISDEAYYKNIAWIQFQRAATEQHLNIIRYFKKFIQTAHGKKYTPIYYEIDDLLTNIPQWNLAYDYYKENFPYIEKMLSLSDCLIVSTQPLKEIYTKYNKNIKIIPNRIPKFLWGTPNDIKETNKIRIFWGGSSNHFAPKRLVEKGINGSDFSNELLNFIIKTRKNYQWVFFGNLPLELEEYKEDIELHNWVPTLQYPNALKQLNIDIGIAPLEDNEFNSCKSNIKMLEYLGSGFPGVYSNVYPYKDASLTSSSGEEMVSQIELLVNDIDKRKEVYDKDRETIGSGLYWEEDDNLAKYMNTYLDMFNLELPRI